MQYVPRGHQSNHPTHHQRPHRFHQPSNTRRQDFRRPPPPQDKRRPLKTGNRRNRKLPQQQKVAANNIAQFRGKFVPRLPLPKPAATASTFPFNPFPSLNPFSFFDTTEKKQAAAVGFTQRPLQQRQPDYLENFNAIQTIPAPDLSNFGPPIIELDSKVWKDKI